MRRKLLRLFEDEEKRKEYLIRELKELPKGKLIIKNTRGSLIPYRKYNGSEKGIGSNRELCILLARKCFISKELAECEKNCEILKKAVDKMKIQDAGKGENFVGKTYERLPMFFNIEEYSYTREQIGKRCMMSESTSYKPEYLKYKTIGGILVRSKSERIIADLLTSYGLNYIYEMKFETEGDVMYPDFAIFRYDGSMILWEHFGLMDNKDYFMKSYMKIERYRRAGYKTHSNLICTYEEDMISENILTDIIERYLI